MAISDLRPDDSAMLNLPGAATWDSGENGAFAEAAGAFVPAGVPVAAICDATYGIGAEGLLDERAHTSAAVEFFDQLMAARSTPAPA